MIHKLIYVTVFSLLFSEAFTQNSYDTKDAVLMQLNDLIENGYEFLGKSEYQILSKGRPASISGGDIWNVTAQIPDRIRQYNKRIIIETGSGSSFSVFISAKTNKAYWISFTPLVWADIDDVNSYLKGKYYIDEDGISQSIPTTNSELVSFKIEMRETLLLINIYAIEMIDKRYRFIE